MSRPYTLWAGIIGGIALTLATHGTDQFLVQRLLAARSAREAARGLVLSGVLVFAQFVLFLLIGVMLFTYYQHVPLPRPLARSDELLPAFIVTALTHGAAGFIVAAIVAAALSPSLNSMAATTVNDFYLKYQRPDADEQTLMRVSRHLDGRLGRRADRGRGRRAMDAAVGARRRSRGAVVRVRLGARRVSARHAGAVHHRGRGICRHARRSGGDDRSSGAGRRVAFTWYVFIGAADHGDGGVSQPGDPRPCDLTAARCPRAHSTARARVLERAIAARTFPAAAVDVGIEPPAAVAGRGRHADGRCRSSPAAIDTPFDLASLTKVHRHDDAS